MKSGDDRTLAQQAHDIVENAEASLQRDVDALKGEARRNVEIIVHPRRWWEICKAVKVSFWDEHNGFMRASAMTYSGFVCVIPLTILLSWMAWRFDYISLLVDWVVEWDSRFNLKLPLDRIVPVIERAHSLDPGSLGVLGVCSLLVTFWLTISNLEAHLNEPLGIKRNRPVQKTFHIYFSILLLFGLAFWVLGFFLSNAREVSHALLDNDLCDPITGIPLAELLNLSMVGGVGVALLWGILYIIYAFLPNRRCREFSATLWATTISTGALVAVVVGMAKLQAFLFSRYALIWGSLAILPVILLTFYVIWVVVLAGGALCSSIEKSLESVREDEER